MQVLSQLKRFADWQIELAQQDRNTDKYKTIARQVYAEYNRLQEVLFSVTCSIAFVYGHRGLVRLMIIMIYKLVLLKLRLSRPQFNHLCLFPDS